MKGKLVSDKVINFKSLVTVLVLLLLLGSVKSADAGSKKSKTAKKDHGELIRPETLLGYSEIMRLKPAARQLYLHRVANMLVDLGRMPSSSRQRILFDARKLTPAQIFEAVTWPRLLFPFASALVASDVCNYEGESVPIKFGGSAVKTTKCRWDQKKNEAICEGGNTLVTASIGPNHHQACVAEKDLRKAMGDRLIDDWKHGETICNGHKEPSSGGGQKDKEKKGQLGSQPCIYAGWPGKTDKEGSCPRPDAPKKMDLAGKSIELTCPSGGGTVVCNPAIFGVVMADASNPGRFTAVCVEPSIHATENCRALSLQPNQKLDEKNKDENLWNPDMAKPKTADGAPGGGDSFGAFRANQKETQKLFQTPGFSDFFNQIGNEVGDFCASGEKSGGNMIRFCVECQAMVKKMEFMNRDALAGAGAGSPVGTTR